nr:hypothetical protein [Polymorphobacter sp.]
MSGSPMINGLSILFTVTTVAVFLYPVIKLTPSWLERRVNTRIVFHRRAFDAIGVAMERAHNDSAQFDRLASQREFHRASLMALAPGELAAETVVQQDINAAA